MESCELCTLIEATPTKNWEANLDGGDVTRSPIGREYTAWTCPDCGQPWLCVRSTADHSRAWSKS